MVAPFIDDKPPTDRSTQLIDRFIVCGMGSLGQYCTLNLKRFAIKSFEVHVTVIDDVQPEWEVAELPDLLDRVILGDCRDARVLMQAEVHQCRAILLVTSHDSVNVEAALAARRLNPQVRLVVRSARQNLNQLLRHQLGNFAAFDPTDLPATAFALAGLNADILGYFKIGNYQLQVIEQQVQPKDYRFDQMPALQIHKRTYRLLSHQSAQTARQLDQLKFSERTFHQWHPEVQIQAGDRIAYIELADQIGRSTQQSLFQPTRQSRSLRQWIVPTILEKLSRLPEIWRWIGAQRNATTIIVGLNCALLLWIGGAILLRTYIPALTWAQAFSNGAILLLGGYGDIFGGLDAPDPTVPTWVNFLCLGITLVSFLFILGVFGLIADALLTTRFNFLRQRPVLPRQNHIVIIGFGRIGQRVAQLLQQFRQPIVVMTEQVELKSIPQIPLIVGDLITELPRVNLATAKSVMLLTDDQMLNLEAALIAKEIAQRANRSIALVIRTYGQRFSDNLHQLLPDAKAMAAYALAAEAFAGAAFGENILGLFRLNQRTILVTEYIVAAGDTLVDRLLSEVAYGYGVMPIFHQKANRQFQADSTEFFMPSDDVKLQVGDRLVVLASLNGLRRIEHGESLSPCLWQFVAQKPLNAASLLDASSTLHRISGYPLEHSRNFMNNLPNTVELKLYEHQAYRLLQELNRQLPVILIPLN